MREYEQCELSGDSPYVELAVEVFSMLADPTRVRIILALRDAELAVGQLAERVDRSPAAVSQHLAKLRLARMVVTRQDGKRVFYRLADGHARRLVAEAIFQAEHALEAEPRHHRQGHPAAATMPESARA
ncbi:metalloregulator ArsR/SmtB family transcription factor [Citricoccus nitrophenolicus]